MVGDMVSSRRHMITEDIAKPWEFGLLQDESDGEDGRKVLK